MWRHKEGWMEGGGTAGKGRREEWGDTTEEVWGTKMDKWVEDEGGQWV